MSIPVKGRLPDRRASAGEPVRAADPRMAANAAGRESWAATLESGANPALASGTPRTRAPLPEPVDATGVPVVPVFDPDVPAVEGEPELEPGGTGAGAQGWNQTTWVFAWSPFTATCTLRW